jgi:hypothetical protein
LSDRTLFAAVAALALLAAPVSLLAEETPVAQAAPIDPKAPGSKGPPQERLERGTFNMVIENDLFFDVDRHYTSGVQASWTTAENDVADWVIEGARGFPLFPPGGTVRANFALGQAMYTSSDIRLSNPPADDRPYAAWTYAAVGLIAENGVALDQVQLALGVVGPAALGETSQKTIHSVIGSPEPKGWDTQIHNEPGILLTYQHSHRAFVSDTIWGLGFDVTPHIGGALGNVHTYANAGGMIRLGQNLVNDYGPPRIQPNLPGSGFFEPQPGIGWYLFLGVDGRVVGRNIFLDGNTFRDSRSVDKEVLVGDVQGGLAITLGDYRLAFTRIYRTREFKTQRSADEFGSVSLSARF